ncbi:MAG TPA: hypothetical protein VFQ22_02790 [Longimicrobiales bacterium]|nr:hypothetical protein [Longimicrobiales bacterium]
MLRRSLFVAALWAVAAPLAAQDTGDEEWVWSGDRPDSEAPIGILGARTLSAGELQIGYRFTQLNSQGVWLANDSLPVSVALQLYPVAPLTLSQQTHTAIVRFGVTDQLTLMGTAEFTFFEREQITNTGIFYITRVEEIGDVTARALYEIYRQGPYRLNVSVGALIPTGETRPKAVTPFSGGAKEALPYDMRPGGGAFAVLPGISGQVQNEHGSVGAQFEARIYVGEGRTDFTPGDVYRADGWAAYNISSSFSVSGGLRWQMWGRLEGADPQLDPTRDPGQDPVMGLAGGQRLDLPLGINFRLPEGSPVAGHRLYAEAVYTLHHDYEGVRLGLDWGINLGWSMSLGS